MGNANGREDGGNDGDDGGGTDDDLSGSNGGFNYRANHHAPPHPPLPERVGSPDLMANSPPHSPALSRSPLMFAPQMGNTSGREDGGNEDGNVGGTDDDLSGSNGGFNYRANHAPPPPPLPERTGSPDLMANSPPHSPALTRSPLMFAPQNPVAPLGRNEVLPFNQMWKDESLETFEPAETRIPTLIMWNYGGNDVTVEGSWDNWSSRKKLQRTGKDHSVLLVLPSGVYHYRFVVDGEQRYIPDLPSVADEMGNICNLLDVHENVPENVESVSEFEAPPSPEMSYSQSFLGAEDFAKEPMAVPPQLHLTVLDMPSSDENPAKPQHVVLNHLFIEKGSTAQSVVALGLTHRFQTKYTTVVLYKPLKR